MLDKPIYKDWIFYLWLLSIISIIPGTLASSKNGGGPGSFLIGVIFQTLLFLVLPSVIRANLRNRKNPDQNSYRKANPSVNSVGSNGSLSRSNKVNENQTQSGCSNTMYAEIELLDGSDINIGYSNDLIGRVSAGKKAKLIFHLSDSDIMQAKNWNVTKISCY